MFRRKEQQRKHDYDHHHDHDAKLAGCIAGCVARNFTDGRNVARSGNLARRFAQHGTDVEGDGFDDGRGR